MGATLRCGTGAQVLKLQAANGFGQEDSTMIIEGMATNGAEPTYCMGDDIPLPVLSSRPHQLGDYFKQRFAQVSTRLPLTPPSLPDEARLKMLHCSACSFP